MHDVGHAEVAVGELVLNAHFLLIKTRITLVTIVAVAIDTYPQPVRTISIAHRCARAVVFMRTQFVGNITGRSFRNRRAKNVDRAMQSVGAVQDAARTANHFNGASLFGIGFKNLVYVAKSGGPHRDAVERHLECAAATSTGQNWRTDRGETLLAIAATDPGARHPDQGFIDVGMTHGVQCTGTNRKNAGRHIAQGRFLPVGSDYN